MCFWPLDYAGTGLAYASCCGFFVALTYWLLSSADEPISRTRGGHGLNSALRAYILRRQAFKTFTHLIVSDSALKIQLKCFKCSFITIGYGIHDERRGCKVFQAYCFRGSKCQKNHQKPRHSKSWKIFTDLLQLFVFMELRFWNVFCRFTTASL